MGWCKCIIWLFYISDDYSGLLAGIQDDPELKANKIIMLITNLGRKNAFRTVIALTPSGERRAEKAFWVRAMQGRNSVHSSEGKA